MSWEGLTPPYATIVADPPWPYDEGWPRFDHESRPGGRSPLPYSAMTVEDIAALPVEDLAVPGSHLYLWTTNRYLWTAKDIALAWGFTPAQVLTWCKEPQSARQLGGMFATATEFVVFAQAPRQKRDVPRAGQLIRQARERAGVTRARLHELVRGGKPTGIVHRWEDDDSLPNQRDWQRLQEVLPALRGVERPYVEPPPPQVRSRIDRNWWQWPRGAHSEKPSAFLDVVEQATPGPYVELFARQPRLGWDSWGWGYEQAAAR